MTKRFVPVALAIAVVLGAGVRTASAEPFIFGFTGSEADAVTLVLNGGLTFSISESQIDANVNNAGWWSGQANDPLADDANDNYLVGSIDGLQSYHNFFTFDLSNLDVPVTSAELRIARSSFCANDTSNGDCVAPVSFGSVEYTLWDVTTPYLTLNDNGSANQGIYDDLGSGISYGSILVSDDGTPNPLMITLNAAALADLTSLVRGGGGFFSIGGALPEQDLPEPASMALLLLGGGAAAFRARRRRAS